MQVLAEFAEYEEVIKKSRFLVYAQTIETPEEAFAFFEAYSDPQATHNCWAYRLPDQYRFNDDGEPGGTAGSPILRAIEGQEVQKVAVLVIRYFGGIKLGSGGLVRAYGGCAAKCLRAAAKRSFRPFHTIRCFIPFSQIQLIKSRFQDTDIFILNEQYDHEGVWIDYAILSEKHLQYQALHHDLTKGSDRWEILEQGLR